MTQTEKENEEETQTDIRTERQTAALILDIQTYKINQIIIK